VAGGRRTTLCQTKTREEEGVPGEAQWRRGCNRTDEPDRDRDMLSIGRQRLMGEGIAESRRDGSGRGQMRSSFCVPFAL
jgi:hypothetical protein